MNKYLGTESGLIGPVPEKPSIRENRFWVKKEYSTKPDFELLKAANELYAEDISSLTPIPCEGWKPEEGREYIRGVDFYLHDTTPPHITVAVPLPASQPSPELDHPEEGAAYLQPAPAAVTDEGEVKETHELKIWPQYFDDVDVDKKPFEVRKTDRLFGIGDILWLREWSPIDGYSGRETRKEITYILHGGQWGIAEGNCVMGLKPISQPAPAPTYPAEFVEWCPNNYDRRKEGWYSWDDIDTEANFPFVVKGGAKSYTTAELYQEWKRINEQSK